MNDGQPPNTGGTTISNSRFQGSAIASGPYASATVHNSGEWTVETREVRDLISELRAELRRLDEDGDATAAAAAATASGPLTQLEAEIERPEKRRDRIQAYLTAVATSLGGLGAVSETVGKLVDAVTKLLG